MPITSVDPAALRIAAQRLDDAADILLGTGRLTRLRFDGAVAGRAHAAAGWRLRAETDRLAGEVSRWARAARELAAALRAGADLHTAAEAHSATALR